MHESLTVIMPAIGEHPLARHIPSSSSSLPIRFSTTYSNSGLLLLELPEGVDAVEAQGQRLVVIKGSRIRSYIQLGGGIFVSRCLCLVWENIYMVNHMCW